MRVPFPVRAVPSLTFKAWLTPPPLKPATAVRDRAQVNDLTPVYFGGVAGYEIGSGPVAIAAHGWGGRAAQMAPIARRLAASGFRVIVPQLPGHAGGRATDIKHVSATLHAIAEDVGQPEVVVAHSFAAMALRLTFSRYCPGRVVLVAPALDVNDALAVFGDRLRLFPWARHGLRQRLEAWDPALWPTMSSIYPAQLPGADVLIVHDPADTETPFSRSAELAAIRPHTSIAPLSGAGHSRILSHETALRTLAGFARAETVHQDQVA